MSDVRERLREKLRNLQHRHHTLLREYSEVKERVREYNTRRHITPGEEMERKTLQRVKLYKKDALTACKRSIDSLEAELSQLAEPR